MNPLSFKIEDKGEFSIIHLSGSAQAVNKQSDEVMALRTAFKELAADRKTLVLIDLKEVEYLASNTIGAFLSGNSILKKIDGKLAIYNASDYIKGILDIVQLGKVLPIRSTLEKALDAIK